MHAMRTVALVGLVAGLLTSNGAAGAQPLEGRTLPALRLAYSNEVTARAEYEAYAARAEAELNRIFSAWKQREKFIATHACEGLPSFPGAAAARDCWACVISIVRSRSAKPSMPRGTHT